MATTKKVEIIVPLETFLAIGVQLIIALFQTNGIQKILTPKR